VAIASLIVANKLGFWQAIFWSFAKTRRLFMIHAHSWLLLLGIIVYSFAWGCFTGFQMFQERILNGLLGGKKRSFMRILFVEALIYLFWPAIVVLGFILARRKKPQLPNLNDLLTK
jgi:hypothetical protein